MDQFKQNRAFMQLPENARARALLKGMGYTTGELKQPRIGVANSWGETSPGHFHLKAVAEAVKAGIWRAGGTPFEFGSFGNVPHGRGQTRHSLRHRHPGYRGRRNRGRHVAPHVRRPGDDLVLRQKRARQPAGRGQAGHPGDHNHGRSHAGRQTRRTGTSTPPMSMSTAGPMASVRPPVSLEELSALEDAACPGPGGCALLGTANTMQCLTEALGAGPARFLDHTGRSRPAKLRLAKDTGERIVELVHQGITSSQIITRESIANAIRVPARHRRVDQRGRPLAGPGL